MDLLIIIIVVYFCINFFVAKKMQGVAILKGYGMETHVFAMVFWLGVIGCIYVAALPDKIQRGQSQKIIELLTENKKDNDTTSNDKSNIVMGNKEHKKEFLGEKLTLKD